jgi:hypothetical protein
MRLAQATLARQAIQQHHQLLVNKPTQLPEHTHGLLLREFLRFLLSVSVLALQAISLQITAAGVVL